MKIIITGSGGQLGRDCRLALENEHSLFCLSSTDLDISSKTQVLGVIADICPDLIINCAAYTAVDNCEQDTKQCFAVNAKGPEYLAQAAQKAQARLFHISTDYVFNGQREIPHPYVESDPVAPLSAYGRSKLAGEEAVRHNCRDHLIIRTAWLYGIGGKNFLKTILRLVLTNPQKTIKIVDDQYGSLTWTYRLALQIKNLIDTDLQGTIHATAEGHASWFQGAECFLQAMKIGDYRIERCTTADYPTPAIRPGNSILENEILKKNQHNVMVPWQDDVMEFVLRFRNLLLEEAQP